MTLGRREGHGREGLCRPSHPGAAMPWRLPVRMPFFSPGSCQLTFSEVSRISVKLRCPTGPGTVPKRVPHPHNAS